MNATAELGMETARVALRQAERRLEDLRAQQENIIASIDRIAAAARAGVLDGKTELTDLSKRKANVDLEIKQAEASLDRAQGDLGRVETADDTVRFERTIALASAHRARIIESFRATCEAWGAFCKSIAEASELSNKLRGPFGCWPHNINAIKNLQTINPFNLQSDADTWACADWAGGNVLPLPSLRPMLPKFYEEKTK